MHLVNFHQAAQRRAVVCIIFLLDGAGLNPVELEIVHHETGHALVNLREEITRGGVECVVQVEDPVRDVFKISFGHPVSFVAAL